MKFSQLMGTIPSSWQRKDEKLSQLQEKVRLGQDEAAAKMLNKACYNNSCMSYSIYL